MVNESQFAWKKLEILGIKMRCGGEFIIESVFQLTIGNLSYRFGCELESELSEKQIEAVYIHHWSPAEMQLWHGDG